MTACELGYDAAVNGPNKINCHFSIFRSEETAREWERGNRDGMEKRRKLILSLTSPIQMAATE